MKNSAGQRGCYPLRLKEFNNCFSIYSKYFQTLKEENELSCFSAHQKLHNLIPGFDI